MSSNQRVIATYSAAFGFQSSDNWHQVQAGLLSQLPLRNIHWKSSLRPSIRTIQELDIALLPLETVKGEHTSQIPGTVLEKPLLNIYVVTCEDYEAYRNTVRKQIKDWHTSITQRKNQEWLILHVSRPDARVAAGKFFQMKSSVVDKIKADFNIDKRDRCVQLAWSQEADNPAAWADLITKIKEGILSALESTVAQREEEVKRSESQRQMPGWNFCTFFILKESLASSFEGVNLFDDALMQYDELEASFYQVLKEKNLSWFGTLISPSPKDDSAPLLSINKKPYRDLILANTISVFDFRIYLLARQCTLLGKLGRINEVGRKTGSFLGAFGRRLREVEATLPRYFVESWTYSSALSVVEQCDTWAKSFKMEGPILSGFNAGKGELLELARNQLDIIGTKVGHLPSSTPFSMAIPSSQPSSPLDDKHSSENISKPELLAALGDREAFYELYVQLTNRAIDMYAKAGRRKFALKLHGSLAALDVHRGRLAAALTTYTSLPAHYAPHMWTSLESYMLSRALDTHTLLDKPKDVEWIHILLAFLKTYVDTLGRELLMQEDNKFSYVSQLVESLRAAADTLETDIIHPDHPSMSIRVVGHARSAETEDGAYLDVMVENHLPCPLPINKISVTVAGRETERFRFSAETETLALGKTSLTLFSPTSSPGTYAFDSSEIQLSHLTFQWNHRRSTLPHAKTARTPPKIVLVRIPRDLQALDVRISQPYQIELGTPPKMLVKLSTGRNHLNRGTVELAVSFGVTFAYKNATVYSSDEGSLEVSGTNLTFLDVPPHTVISALLPHSDASTLHVMKVQITVDYTTKAEPSTARKLNLTRVVATSLPIAVNVQDFFRGTRLFSKFTISTTSHQHVRISSAQLQLPGEGFEGVTIKGSRPQNRVMTVTPAQPANFLFALDSANGPVRESLSLLITYKLLRDEVETLIRNSVAAVVDFGLVAQREDMVKRLVETLETDASWVERYSITGELDVPPLKEDEGDLQDAFKQVREVLLDPKHLSDDEDWREIKIPVDVPQMSIVAAARIQILPPTTAGNTVAPLYAGQPISAVLTITTSLHWGTSAFDKKRKFNMRFDVEEMVREWLVSGRKRGDFAASDGSTFTIPITLIALHHGEIPLPKVAVIPLPLVGEQLTMGSMAVPSTETYQEHGAEKVLVLPRGGRSTFVVGMGGMGYD